MNSPLKSLFRVARLAHRLGLQSSALYRLPADRFKRWLYRTDHGLPPHRVARCYGFHLHIPYTLTHDYFLKPFESETTKLVETLLGSGAVFVDVGANIGYFTLLAAHQVGTEGRVVAVEPSHQNLSFLRHNVQTNGLKQVEVVEAAAGASRCSRPFFVQSVGVLDGFYSDQGSSHLRRAVDVQQLPLDEIVEGAADLVKIDVEGAELEVLEGMRRLISRCPGLHLIVEWNPSALSRAGIAPTSLPQRLVGEGFLLRLLDTPPGSPETVEEVSTLIRAGELSSKWVANLHASPYRSSVRP